MCVELRKRFGNQRVPSARARKQQKPEAHSFRPEAESQERQEHSLLLSDVAGFEFWLGHSRRTDITVDASLEEPVHSGQEVSFVS